MKDVVDCLVFFLKKKHLLLYLRNAIMKKAYKSNIITKGISCIIMKISDNLAANYGALMQSLQIPSEREKEIIKVSTCKCEKAHGSS